METFILLILFAPLGFKKLLWLWSFLRSRKLLPPTQSDKCQLFIVDRSVSPPIVMPIDRDTELKIEKSTAIAPAPIENSGSFAMYEEWLDEIKSS